MRWTIAFFAIALIALQLELWLGDDRRPGLRQLEAAVESQTTLNQSLVDRNVDLEAEIINLRQAGAAVEERARSELGLVLPGETYFQIYEIEPASATADE